VTIKALREQLAALGFEQTALGRSTIYLARSIAGHAGRISRHLSSIDLGAQAAGNRRSAVRLDLAGLPPMYARRCRRGGLARLVVSDLYAGTSPRPLRELVVSAIARQRGLPVAEPLGAIVETAGPLLYRGWFLSRALEGQTLWDLLLGGAAAERRHAALRMARASIDSAHQAGLFHSDLNFHNLFCCTSEGPVCVMLLDLDKARFAGAPLAGGLRKANFRRLRRSAARLAKHVKLSYQERAIIGLV
jgi:hypothetical protein